MNMKTGERWHCTNPACRSEVLVQTGSGIEGGNPRCVCGAPLKKSYALPHFTYLEFLKADEATPARDRSRES